MTRRVRRKLEDKGKDKIVSSSSLDWTSLDYDAVLHLFTCLNHRDRASLASTCKTWRALGASSCLWTSLDLRPHKLSPSTATSLASRCTHHLRSLRFRGVESADSIINLKARSLLEVSGDYCRKITDATLAMIAARHEGLESLELGPDFCEKITGDAIEVVAFCCPKLKKLRLSGLRDVTSEAVEALAKNCTQLTDLGLLDCLSVDEDALGRVVSLQYLSVAGTSNIKWSVASSKWDKLPKLIGLDVSRTDVGPGAVSRLLTSSKSLKVLCAVNCRVLEEDTSFMSSNRFKGKVLLALFTNVFDGVASLFADTTKKKPKEIFSHWRGLEDKSAVDETMRWIEWIVSHTLLRTAESNPQGLDEFWLKQGAALLLTLMQSSQEDVQERSATGLATFVVIDDENASIDCGRAEAVMREGGIRLLLDLANSWREGLQSEAAKAIANLSVNADVAKTVADEGGIRILAGLAKSMNRLVAEEAAGGLWNLSVGEEHKSAIAEAGGVKALVDLIFRWPNGSDGVLVRFHGSSNCWRCTSPCDVSSQLQLRGSARTGKFHFLYFVKVLCY
ncbi:hypothetical protein F2Q69_00018043 [Brassica cretica]|uniref:F-box domain-containing protein n=1 Tax=Brassica cretica TaxID=69181 RepID=A0A8S9QU56_BRACR|nr:hypothetical protein F2Q69_00018043 [Brassica cretica]